MFSTIYFSFFLLICREGTSGYYVFTIKYFLLFFSPLWLYYDYVRNGPFHAFSHVDAGSPPSAHDLHAGYGRSMSKPSYFTPHISQNSPSRLGQQPPQRFSHGRPTVRGSEWNHIKVQPPSSSFNSGGQRSPGSSSLNNSMPWGTFLLICLIVC